MILWNKEKTKHGIFFPFYSILMLLFYLGYLLLENYRLNNSTHWLSKNNLTEANVESIIQLGTWTSNFEFAFLSLFTITMCISIFSYRKRKNRENIKRYLVINIILFIAITIISFVLLPFTQLPIGNLIQPIVIPTYLLGGLLIYMLWVSKKHRLVEKEKN